MLEPLRPNLASCAFHTCFNFLIVSFEHECSRSLSSTRERFWTNASCTLASVGLQAIRVRWNHMKYLVCFMFSVLPSRSYLPPVVLSRSQKIFCLLISRRSIICNRMLTRTFLLVQVRRFDGLLPLRLWRESWVYRRSLDDQRQQDFFF